MFLEKLNERNPRLIDAAVKLHQNGTLLPDTYIIDLPTLLDNASMILAEAKKHGLNCLYMSKQIGRNADIGKMLEDMGYDGAVAVDYREALHLAEHQLKIWNVGHLVQPPKACLDRLISYGVKFFTVYTIEKMREIDTVAQKTGLIQSIMIKVADNDCLIYDGQQSGFSIDDLDLLVDASKSMPNIKIEGVTSFPCMLYNEQTMKIEKTANFDLLIQAKRKLESLGCRIIEVNAPSSNTAGSMELAAQHHATTVEPGHALTGTTPYHAQHSDGEIPAMLYLTEVSHDYQNVSYCYGGGHYRRSHMKNAFVVDFDNKRASSLIEAPSDDNIDYAFKLERIFAVSSTVIACFRTQIFTTRSHVALIDNRNAEPILLGLYDAHGYRL